MRGLSRRFTLRTLLMGVLGAAFVSWWFLRPHHLEIDIVAIGPPSRKNIEGTALIVMRFRITNKSDVTVWFQGAGPEDPDRGHSALVSGKWDSNWMATHSLPDWWYHLD